MKAIAIDTETTGLFPWGTPDTWGFHPARPFAVSWCYEDGRTGYVRFEVDPFTREVLFRKNPRGFKKVQRMLLTNTIKVFHNAPFDLMMLKISGWEIKEPVRDTIILSHVVTGGDEISYELKTLADKYLDFSKQDQNKIKASTRIAIQKASAKGWCIATKMYQGRDCYMADYWLADPDLCKDYAIKDVERTMLLWQLWLPEMESNEVEGVWWNDNNPMKALFDQEHRLMPVLADMERLGSRVFLDVVNKMLRYYRAYSKKQSAKMAELGYADFNPRSPKQKKQYFIEKMGYEPIRYTDAGNPSCDGEFLKHCAEVHKDPMARAVLEMSNAEIAISSHFQTWHDLGIPDVPGSKVIVLHPSFKQTGTRTGRISCTRPNLMNIPSEQTGKRKSKVAMKGRQCFGPRPGYYWYLPDYSQVEVRLFAYLSKSKDMVQAILDGEDFHSYVTKQVWGGVADYEARPRYYRKRGKQINFTKLYGGGPTPVAMELECTHEEAKRFIEEYDERLPDVKRFMDEIKSQVIRDGFIVSPFGRHYYMDPRFAYRATNYIVQGTAGDIMKRGMIYIDDMLKKDWPEAHLLIQVHDEVCIEVPAKYHSKKLMRQILFEMQRGADLIQVPGLVKADMKFTSSDWSRTTEIELEVA